LFSGNSLSLLPAMIFLPRGAPSQFGGPTRTSIVIANRTMSTSPESACAPLVGTAQARMYGWAVTAPHDMLAT